MDHEYIEELDLIRRYLMGRLTADENTEFEEHFVDCSQCVDQLKTTKDMIFGFRLVASRQSPEEADYDIEKPRWYSPRISPKWFALAASLILLIVIAGTFTFNRSRLARVETDEAKSESSRLEQRLEEQRQSAESVDSKHQETERELTERLTQLQAELEGKREPGNARPQNGSLQPQINIPMFVLKTMRGGAPRSESINSFTLPHSPTSFVILVSLEGELGYRDYRITILDGQAREIWKSGGLRPDSHNTLKVGLHSGFFHAGDYVITVEGVGRDGTTSLIARYRFLVS